MPSQKPSMIDALRAKHDPHYQLASKVEGLGKDLPIQVAQLHKTLSKSFAMQRKTLVRVLGLEKKVADNETRISNLADVAIKIGQQQAEKEEAAVAAVEELVEEVDEIPEGLDDLIDEVRGEKEVGDTKTKTKPKAKAKPKPKAKAKPKAKVKPKVKPKAKKTRVTGRRIRKPKIDADKFKRGTSQETLEERLERQARNRQETAAAEEHKKTDEFTETTTGTDPKTGEPLSSEERKRRFKAAKFMNKTGFDSKDIKPETEAEMGEDSKKDNVIAFLNGDVKDNLDDIKDDLKQIEGLISDQNKSADEQYEEMRQGILAGKKKKREEELEKKDKKPGDNKMLDMVTKPVGNFLDKLVNFVMMTFVGSVINRVLSLLKDPAQLLDPIKRFFNLVIGLVNSVMKGLWNVTGAPMNFIIGGINNGVSSLLDAINKATGLLKIPPIEAPQIPLIPGPPEFEYIPLSKTAQEKNEAVGMAGGGLVPGYKEGGVVTDPEERQQQEAYMLKFVNEERALQGLEPLTDLTYAPGVELTKAVGPGPRTKEISNTNFDFDTGFKTSTKSKTVDGKTTFSGGMSLISEEERQKFFAENPHAAQLLNIKNQIELDNLGADISASAKMSGGGLVQNLNVRRQGFGGGGYAAPYPTNNLLGMGHNVIDTAPENIMGYNKGGKVIRYNKGGKVPGSGTGDTVPAMLTPGEFVMSKGAVNMIGADKLMAMNKAGGGTNVPKMMKFAGGGIVPGIDAPSGRGSNVIVVGGGGGSKAPRGVQSSGSSGSGTPRFSSTDPNNITIPVVKSVYNIMS